MDNYETANDIKKKIERILHSPCYRDTEQDLDDLLRECIRIADLLIDITKEKS